MTYNFKDFKDFKEFQGFQNFQNFESEKNDFVDEQEFHQLSDYRPKLDICPLASFFEETKSRSKEKTFGSWLKVIDDDTIKMIVRYGEMSLYETNADDDELIDEVADYWCLTIFAVGWEMQSEIVPKKEFEDAMVGVYFLTVAEDFFRKGISKIEGSSSLINYNETKITLTPEGKNIAKQIQKEYDERDK